MNWNISYHTIFMLWFKDVNTQKSTKIEEIVTQGEFRLVQNGPGEPCLVLWQLW